MSPAKQDLASRDNDESFHLTFEIGYLKFDIHMAISLNTVSPLSFFFDL